MDIVTKRILELIGSTHGEKKKLAEAIGAAPNAVSEWQSGRSKSYRKYLPQIAEYYGISLDWLSGLTDEKEPIKKTATISDDGLDNLTSEIMNIVRQLSPERQKIVLAQIKALQQLNE